MRNRRRPSSVHPLAGLKAVHVEDLRDMTLLHELNQFAELSCRMLGPGPDRHPGVGCRAVSA
ncbi:hypothetical protein [Streptomyces sp. Inha503]|uniref:hypothetical protein n=1 Tax=Streptomyces sp. Inha503 TaxID=3383314 RepID=UPI00399FA3E9